MSGTRKRYRADFKAKVALEALRGKLTATQVTTKHGIHPTMVNDWKRQAQTSLASLFFGRAAAKEAAQEGELDRLHAKIGQLVVDRDFLAKVSGRRAGRPEMNRNRASQGREIAKRRGTTSVYRSAHRSSADLHSAGASTR
ncbi:MAG: transposase [Rhodospirillales bacterium]